MSKRHNDKCFCRTRRRHNRFPSPLAISCITSCNYLPQVDTRSPVAYTSVSIEELLFHYIKKGSERGIRMRHLVKGIIVLVVLCAFFSVAMAAGTETIRWEQPRCIDEAAKTKNISAAFFENRLHVVHRGLTNDKIYHHYYSNRWHGQAKIPHQSSADAPSLATPKDQLWMFHTSGGKGKDTRVWRSQFNGTFWEDDAVLPRIKTNIQPAVFGGQNSDRVQLLFKGKSSSQLYWGRVNPPYGSSDKVTTDIRKLDGQKSNYSPTLVRWQGILHHVHRDKSGHFWYSCSSGLNDHIWKPNFMIPGIKGTEPWLVVIRGKMYLFFLSQESKKDPTRLGYLMYENKGMWSQVKYHDFNKKVNDVVIAINPADHKAHMVFVEKGAWKIYHTKQFGN